MITHLINRLRAILTNLCMNTYWLLHPPPPPMLSHPQASLWYIQTAYPEPNGLFRRDPERSALWSDRAAMLADMARTTGPGGVLTQWSPASTLGYQKPDDELHQWRDAQGKLRYFYVSRYKWEEMH